MNLRLSAALRSRTCQTLPKKRSQFRGARHRFDDLQPEELVTGHYRFGANELSIYRALAKIIDMLEADYGLKVPR